MSDPSCRTFRELLGVYVVGAIEPAERAELDAHLSQCYECREELAELAVLPALLHRIPVDEAERIAASGPEEPGLSDPSPAVLDSLLARVGAKRRTRRLRSAFTVAAAILIAAGGATAATEALATGHPVAHGHTHHVSRSLQVVSAASGHVKVTVHYGTTNWHGTTMWVRASGLPEWTQCSFYVVTKDGGRILAGGWTTGPDGGELWYPVRSSVPVASVTGFVLTAGHKLTMSIPAA